jgi:hypothetical protein
MPCAHPCSVSVQPRVPLPPCQASHLTAYLPPGLRFPRHHRTLSTWPQPGRAARLGGAFLRDLSAALHPDTGALVVNLHRADASRRLGVPGPESAARAFRCAGSLVMRRTAGRPARARGNTLT